MREPTERWRELPALVPATALVALHPADGVPPVPVGPEGGGDD
ncbi:hypothetical protein GCM10009623_02470 [Nocardioides aestuarii]|uniref:Uncharacterized protein n=1 Tax=Nocardioides aestuarii TaxID=252231 RepID=A0ABW4TGQ8_9ACTN